MKLYFKFIFQNTTTISIYKKSPFVSEGAFALLLNEIYRLMMRNVFTSSPWLTDKIDAILMHNYSSTHGTNNEIGMGMGLQLVQKLAEKINAKLSIESQLNEGTAIQLNLN